MLTIEYEVLRQEVIRVVREASATQKRARQSWLDKKITKDEYMAIYRREALRTETVQSLIRRVSPYK